MIAQQGSYRLHVFSAKAVLVINFYVNQIEQGSLLCDPETLFHKACTVAHDEKLPKPAKFERFVAFGAENHVLHVWFDMVGFSDPLTQSLSLINNYCFFVE